MALEMENLFVRMDDESFNRLSTYVTREYGIKLPVNKRSMLESRLNKKVKSLGMDNYKQFLDFIFSDSGKHERSFPCDRSYYHKQNRFLP